MYHWFTAALKNEIVRTVSNILNAHPFYNKVVVSGAYPYEERPQFAVTVKNQGGDPRKFSPDNFLGHLSSHVYLVRVDQKPGTSIEWVTEDVTNLSEVVTEDLTSQVTGGNTVFKVSRPPIVGSVRSIGNIYARDPMCMISGGDLRPATSPSSVWVRVNSVAAYVFRVNGEVGEIELVAPPQIGDLVEVTYLTRKLVQSGLYYFDFLTEDSVQIYPLRVVTDEMVLRRTQPVPATPSFSLQHGGIRPGSVRMKLRMPSGTNHELMEPRDFTVDLATGAIVFVKIPLSGEEVTASYKYYAGEVLGPFSIGPNIRVDDILPGVVLGFGRGLQKDDKMVVGVMDERKDIMDIYGGKWDFKYTLEIRTRDPIQREEIVDLLSVSLWQVARSNWVNNGIVLDEISLGGEAEDVVDDLSGDVQYMQEISMGLISDWEVHVPFPEFLTEIDMTYGGHNPSLPDNLMFREAQGLILVEDLPIVPPLDMWSQTEDIF